jgi:hypothetical protein
MPDSSKENSAMDGNSVELRSSEYVNDGGTLRPGAPSSNSSIKLQTVGNKELAANLGVKWDIDTEYSAAENWNYFRPHEAAIVWGDLALGRKESTWTSWEKRWNQAVFQPRFMDDKARPSVGGLTGLFYDKKMERMNFEIGALPIYIPEMGPHFYTQNDKFVSKNPWFHPPPDTFNYRGVPTQVDYTLAEPDYLNIISNPGAVAQVDWKPTEKTFSRVSYGYKPIPQVLLGFPMDRPVALPGTMHIQAIPRVVYSHVANYDLNYSRSGGKNDFSVSVAREWIQRDHTPDDWQTQELKDAWIASGSYTHYLNETRSMDLEFSFLKIWGGDTQDRGIIDSSEGLFEKRFQYTEALSAQVSKRWRSYQARFKVIYDRLQNGAVYSTDFSAQLNKKLGVNVASDFFALFGGGPPVSQGFIETYRGNDRLTVGMNYVF